MSSSPVAWRQKTFASLRALLLPMSIRSASCSMGWLTGPGEHRIPLGLKKYSWPHTFLQSLADLAGHKDGGVKAEEASEATPRDQKLDIVAFQLLTPT